MLIGDRLSDLIGRTPLLKINSLSKLAGCEIFVKCEQTNPGGSIKDRAALQMVKDAIEAGKLKEGMTIVEGTAGNTGIGLAVVAKSFGLNSLAVMPKGQAIEKERMISLFGGELKLVEPVPFASENHFYHTAKGIADENPSKYWWADQFENLSNFKAHYENTAPEIFEQMNGEIDIFITSAGTGGTIGGNSKYFKEKLPGIKCYLVDPQGSGLKNFLEHGEFKSEGSSITEGIGIMRLVNNFKQADIDGAITLPDQDIVTLSRYVRDNDGVVLGTSSALNLAGAFYMAIKHGPGKRIVTFQCELGERSYSKLYNSDFLKSKALEINGDIASLLEKYKGQ